MAESVYITFTKVLWGGSIKLPGDDEDVQVDEQVAAPSPPATPAPPPSPPPTPANPVFESAMGTVAFGVLCLAFVCLLILFAMACLNAFGPVVEQDLDADFLTPQKTVLYAPWSAFVWLVVEGGILAKILTGVGAILTVGVKVIAQTTNSRWLALTIIWLCLGGVLVSVLLMWQLSGSPDFGNLRSPTDLDDAAFKLRLYGVLIAFAAWFLAFLGRQVGVSGAVSVMKNAMKQWKGDTV